MQIDAAMKNRTYFQPERHDETNQSMIEYETLLDFTEIDEVDIKDRINSQNSQGSEP